MPWVKQEDCIGCESCVRECPTDAISMEEEIAGIDMSECIRCGVCHDVCPQDAVRHDSEKIPVEVEENIEWTKDLMDRYYDTKEEKEGFVRRIKKHFKKEKQIAERTLERLESLRSN